MTLLNINFTYIGVKLLLIFVIVMISFGVALYSTWGERKAAALLQDRRGPNRAGPFGLFQPFADGIKLFFKEEIVPTLSDKWLFILAPAIAMTAALVTSAVIPWGSDVQIAGTTIPLQIADVNIGMLYIMGVTSVGVYGIMIGGWASNNKFSLISAVRGASQAISYELAMGMSLIALLMISGSLSLKTMVEQQAGHVWYVFYQPVGFFIFLICAFAECNRTPFDLAEADNELNMGYHQEYSSMKMGFYLFAEYVNMFIASVVLSTLYFGGYNLPHFIFNPANHATYPNLIALVGFVTLMVKVVCFIFFFMWVRWTVPRFRYDQLMNLGWKRLLPLALLNMLVTAVIILWLKK